jgi:hypothetical protein
MFLSRHAPLWATVGIFLKPHIPVLAVDHLRVTKRLKTPTMFRSNQKQPVVQHSSALVYVTHQTYIQHVSVLNKPAKNL